MTERTPRARRSKRRKPIQLELPVPNTHGGARRGAGRKPNGARAGVSHLARPRLSRRHPVHVTLRVQSGIPVLRKRRIGRLFFGAFASARERFGVRLTHFSIQHNHLHLIVEAANERALSRALQGLSVRLARRLNRLLGRKGSVFADRYHARALRTPLEVRRALLYVMNNYRKHVAQRGGRPARDWVDPYSSADCFDGFERAAAGRPRAGFSLSREPPTCAPRTWLLRIGWRRHGLLRPSECPA